MVKVKNSLLLIFLLTLWMLHIGEFNAYSVEVDSLKSATVIVQPIFKGVNTLTGNEEEKPKTTEGFLVFQEGNGINKYYLVTVNHVLLFFFEDEKELNFKCSDPEMRPHKIDIYGKSQSLILSIGKDSIKSRLKASNRESSKEKADVVVIDITGMLDGGITSNCINYSFIATKDICDKINLELDNRHKHIGYYSFINKKQLQPKPIYKEGILLSKLGKRYVLPDGRYFQGFKVKFVEAIERGDCGAPIFYNYKGNPHIVGLINTTIPIHPDITQDSLVIIDNIEQF